MELRVMVSHSGDVGGFVVLGVQPGHEAALLLCQRRNLIGLEVGVYDRVHQSPDGPSPIESRFVWTENEQLFEFRRVHLVLVEGAGLVLSN
jgi:hypothetical protein